MLLSCPFLVRREKQKEELQSLFITSKKPKNQSQAMAYDQQQGPLRILCLHGFRHNSYKLKHSMAQLIRRGKPKNIIYDFLDAPFKHPDFNDSSTDPNVHYKQWYETDLELVLSGGVQTTHDTLDQSLVSIYDKWTSDGPYDGILGFSQGSVVIQHFLLRYPNLSPKPKVMILAGPFTIRQEIRNIPCLILHGEKDDLVNNEYLEIPNYISPCTIIIHPGGHYISSKVEFCQAVNHYLETIIMSEQDILQKQEEKSLGTT
jgi:hypothetical protein